MSISFQCDSSQFETSRLATTTSVPTTASVVLRGTLAPWQVRRVRRYIEENIEQRLGSDVLARVACRSRSHFCRAFKRTCGVTVHEYVTQRRIEHAMQMMATTPATLSAIASTCGMSDHSHFTRMFRRFFAESPSAWRQRHRFSQGVAAVTRKLETTMSRPSTLA